MHYKASSPQLETSKYSAVGLININIVPTNFNSHWLNHRFWLGKNKHMKWKSSIFFTLQSLLNWIWHFPTKNKDRKTTIFTNGVQRVLSLRCVGNSNQFAGEDLLSIPEGSRGAGFLNLTFQHWAERDQSKSFEQQSLLTQEPYGVVLDVLLACSVGDHICSPTRLLDQPGLVACHVRIGLSHTSKSTPPSH